MDKGLYNAASSMMIRLAQADMLAHNLANVATPGFRAVRHSLRSFGDEVRSAAQTGETSEATESAKLPLGVTVAEQKIDLEPGAIYQTGNPLDLAIDGEAFFAAQRPEGVRYTRKGNFGVDASGALTTAEGSPVLAADGSRLIVGQAQKITVAEDGEVTADQQVVGRLALFQFADGKALQTAGDGYYVGVNPQPAADSRMRQGYLEGSNVKPLTELVSLIEALRSYEAAARAMRAAEDATQALRETARG